MTQQISISTNTIVRVLLLLGLVAVFVQLRAVLLLFFIAFVLSTILNPFADFFKHYRVPRTVTVLITYVVALALIIGIGFALAPLLVQQISQIAENFGVYWDSATRFAKIEATADIRNALQTNLDSIVNTVRAGLTPALAGVFATVRGIIGAVASVVVVLVLTFYMVVEEEAVRRALNLFTPKKYEEIGAKILFGIQHRLGGWVRGQLVLSLIIGIAVFIALSIIGVPYAFALGVLAFLLEFIPYVGPILSGVFGVFFALSVSPGHALAALIAYYILQLLENNFIVPKIMERAVGINPVFSIISILVFYNLLGVIGVFLAIPIATMILVVKDAFVEYRLETESSEI